jgi:hypothetical protein
VVADPDPPVSLLSGADGWERGAGGTGRGTVAVGVVTGGVVTTGVVSGGTVTVGRVSEGAVIGGGGSPGKASADADQPAVSAITTEATCRARRRIADLIRNTCAFQMPRGTRTCALP